MKAKKKGAKILALLLAVCMVFGMIPVTSMAAEQTLGDTPVSDEALDGNSRDDLSGVEGTTGGTEETTEGTSTGGTENTTEGTSTGGTEETTEGTSTGGTEETTEGTSTGGTEETTEGTLTSGKEDTVKTPSNDETTDTEEQSAVLQAVSNEVDETDVETNMVSSVSRINVQAAEAGVYELMQAEFAAKGKTVTLVYNDEKISGDIFVDLNGASNTYGTEGYEIVVANGIVTVKAAANAGAVYGLQDVLQQLEKGSVSSVSTTQPYKGTRALFVDCARKYFSVDWFEEIIREMAWNGMNTLYISFSNDEGFRFLLDDMSLSFDDGDGNTVTYDDEFMSHMVDNPEKVADSAFLTERNANATDEGNSRVVTNYDNNKYLTQDNMERILAYAKAYGINVIPELNTPGHFGQILWYFPEYRIQGTWYEDGQPHYGLDLTNTEAFNFGQALVKKYADFFAENGCTDFCVGGDEYLQGNATNEQVAAYTNRLVEYVESKGMTAYAWNDGQAAAQKLLKDSAVVNAWNGTSTYNLINFDNNKLYYVLKGQEWKPNAQTLFETWTPNVYNDGTELSNMLGASLAIWCDVPNKETPAYVLESMIPNIQAFGYKMWNYSETVAASLTDEYTSYSDFAAAVTDAPAVASSTVLSTVGYESDVNTDTTTLPEPLEGGEGYELVTFNAPSVSTKDGWYSGEDNLIDGDTGTVAWTNSEQDVGDYVRVDLGSLQSINTITITSPSGTDDICTDANVEVSSDGSTWTNIGTHSGNSESYDVNSDIRYIQVVITKAKSNWWQIAEIDWSPKSANSSTIEDGTYIIVNDTNKAMTNTASGSGFSKQDVTITNNIATPVNPVYEWTFNQQSDGTYYIKDSNGAYLNIGSNGISTSATAQKITATISGGKVQLSNGNNAINYYASNGQIFERWNAGTNDGNNMQTLYKKLAGGLRTVDLYNLIIEASEYENSDNRYGSDEFANLQSVLKESISLYISASEEGTTITQDEINAQVTELEAAIEALKISDTTLSYIEIPVEVLDFRADGVMFEYAQNEDGKGLYELLIDTKFGNQLTYANKTVAMPGEVGDRITADEWHISESELMGWYENCKRTGLVENYLVNGAPVYKEATVDYVAKLIAKGYFADLSGTVANWNGSISSKVEALYEGYDAIADTNSNLGTWTDTIAKTSAQTNGGDMAWDDIDTCYDLAYYVLNNMWRSTEATDGEDTYNKVVPERTILRMLADENGYYHLDSTKEISYNGNYIYNTDLSTENTAETKFTPINNLGYESSSKYGDTTDTTNGVNFHYTLHANGSFVYNADDNLYFYFDGDDDVYYYINGQLVMDIGGAHAHCDDEIYLNDIADELGLVDGGIYTFDMFYAERHTTQANLEFRTNIKIMDTMSTTSKGQYVASTEEMIPYGSIVDEGTTVAYSFNLLNLRSVNVTDISFIDENLGSNISKNNITLYDSSKTNDATTDIEDIKVYYHTYDRTAPSESGVLNTETPVAKTVAEITAMINTANSNGYSSLESGSYVVSIQTEDELKSLLEIGVPIDTQICIYGVKRNVVDTDRPYVNTVTSRAYYTSNNKKVALNGIATQKLTVLNSFEKAAEKEKIVIDYGKAVQIKLADITENLHLNDGVTATFYGITTNGTHNQIRTSTSGITESKVDTAYTSAASNGTYYLRNTDNGDVIEFKLNQMLSEVEKVYMVYKIADSSLADTDYEEYYMLVELDIIPATNIYYETNFADGVFSTITTGSAWTTNTVNGDSENKDDDVQNEGTIGVNQVYGFDSTYTEDAYLSDGSSLFVEGQGIKLNDTTANYTYSQFEFTGTGFDLISRTGADQGAIRVDIYTDAARTAENRVKSVTVLNKSESNLELYQIPVVSVNDLDYDKYYVTVGVNAAYNNTQYPQLNRGDDFYFDAIRIYDSAKGNTEAEAAYVADGEYAPIITEVRAQIIAAGDYDVTTTVDGMSFIDRTQSGVDVATYTTIGPNNEVYLANGQGIAFEVSSTADIASIDIAAKAPNNGASAQLTANISDTADNVGTGIQKNITSATPQYFDLMEDTTADLAKIFANGKAYVVIRNTGEGTLSITDIKVAYGDKAGTVAYTVSEDAITFANTVVNSIPTEEPNYDIISAGFTSNKCKLFGTATMTVVTSTDVKELKMTGLFGMNANPTIKSIEENEEGQLVWTIQMRMYILGNKTYTVTGYGEDGTSGASATASIRVKLF